MMDSKNYIKACKRGEREARLENATGFVSNTHVHINKKKYNRSFEKNNVKKIIESWL